MKKFLGILGAAAVAATMLISSSASALTFYSEGVSGDLSDGFPLSVLGALAVGDSDMSG